MRVYPHVITLFRHKGAWGAISKTNGVALRYRDPVYRSLRELALSYFHEYSDRRGRRTLRSYSGAFDLRRLEVAPGLTCLWQVQGRNAINFHKWMELDLAYIDSWSLALDLKILLKTIPAVLGGRGAS